MSAFKQAPNFGEVFRKGDRFVVCGMKDNGEIQTKFGPAKSSMVTIVSRDHPTHKRTYLALGVGINRQACQAEASDFPQVVELTETPTSTAGNSVKLLSPVEVDPREFLDGNDGPALNLASVVEASPEEGEGPVDF